MIARGDTVGVIYERAAVLRRKRKRSSAEDAFLKQFEADLAAVNHDPVGVCDKAIELTHRGQVLLEMIIRERFAQGQCLAKDTPLLGAVCTFSSVVSHFIDALIRLAEEGQDWACQALFAEGKRLASAFSRLAIAYPEHFRALAEQSLTMPSLRARNAHFTCDAESIVKAIHLAERHAAPNVHDNRSRLGALCHQLVAEVVDLIEGARLEARERGGEQHKYANLPELRGNAKTWWRLVLKDRVHSEFTRMRQDPCRNPALWEELRKATDNGSVSARKAAFDKYCFNKLQQIAGKPLPLA